MPIKPPGSPFAMVMPGGTAYLTINDFTYERTFLPFTRSEFLTDRLRQAKNVDGSMPVYYTGSGGRVFQFEDTCNSAYNTTRPLVPDDSYVDNIYNRFDRLQFVVTGDACDQATVDLVGSAAGNHQILLAEFEAHQEIAKGDFSYTFLVNLQDETFSYLTTGSSLVQFVGASAGGFSGTSNVLITRFVSQAEYENPIYGTGTSEVLSSFRLEMEVRTLLPARSSSF
jgi:hypothetical protein